MEDIPTVKKTSTTNLYYHFVFVTKHRKPLFLGIDMKDEVHSFLKEAAGNKEITLKGTYIESDRLDFYVTLKPKESITNIVKSFKSTIAKRLVKAHPELGQTKIWSSSFYAETLGNENEEAIENFINKEKRI